MAAESTLATWRTQTAPGERLSTVSCSRQRRQAAASGDAAQRDPHARWITGLSPVACYRQKHYTFHLHVAFPFSCPVRPRVPHR